MFLSISRCCRILVDLLEQVNVVPDVSINEWIWDMGETRQLGGYRWVFLLFLWINEDYWNAEVHGMRPCFLLLNVVGSVWNWWTWWQILILNEWTCDVGETCQGGRFQEGLSSVSLKCWISWCAPKFLLAECWWIYLEQTNVVADICNK